MSHGYEINWVSSDPALLSHPLYQKYFTKSFGTIGASIGEVKTDVGTAIANRESAAVVSYLCWLIRVTTLLA